VWPLHLVTFLSVPGIAILIYSVYASWVIWPTSWLYLAGLTLAASLLPIRIPSVGKRQVSLKVTFSDVFVFTALLFYAPEVAVCIRVVDRMAAGWRHARRENLLKVLLSLGRYALVTFTVGHLFYWLQATEPPLDPEVLQNLPLLFLNLGWCAVLCTLLKSASSVLANPARAWLTAGSAWREGFLWVGLTNTAAALGAGVVLVNLDHLALTAGIILPVVLVIYFAYRVNLFRIQGALQRVDEIAELHQCTITSLSMAIDAKDQNAHGHIQRVQTMVLELAKHCGVNDQENLQALRAAALLHDIGKLAIPGSILNKPGRLTEAEMQKIRDHAAVGAEILETVPFPYPVAPFVRHHHERWDGAGYPDKLKGEEIPLGARILSVVDCYDALRSDRPFRPKLSREVALNIIKQESGGAYDPAIVELLLEHIDEMESNLKQFKTEETPKTFEKLEGIFEAGRVASRQEPERPDLSEISSGDQGMLAVYEVSRSIGKSLNAAETMHFLANTISQFIPFSALAIHLLKPKEDFLVPQYVAGIHEDALRSVQVRVGEGVTGWVAANKHPLGNVSPTPDFAEYPSLQSAFESCLAVPLVLEENVVGVITLYSDKPDGYRDHFLRLMEMIAPQAAAAIKNALIHEEAWEDAHTDALTGLPNLRYFNSMIDDQLKQAEVSGSSVTLLMLDMERFKTVNDQWGHKKGDEVLAEVARTLRMQMRQSDTFVRYGGDEFVGVLPGVSKEQAKETIGRIQAAIDRHRFEVREDQEISIGISVGAATYPEDGLETDALLKVADQAMYFNKFQRLKRASSF
jgi:diguanylate cyclase (GGDEF)-like protein/putative nucleotidyltransferase with HDIG domain